MKLADTLYHCNKRLDIDTVLHVFVLLMLILTFGEVYAIIYDTF